MKEIFKPAFVLVTITVIAGFLLGLVNQVTLKPIEEQKNKTIQQSLSEIIPEADSFPIELTPSENDTVNGVNKVYTAYMGSEKMGYVVNVSVNGYGGEINMMIGLDLNAVVLGAKIISHNETPGLGANAALPAFLDQFKNKTGPLSVTKIKNDTDIEAVSSATITSNAVTNAVNIAIEFIKGVE